MMELNVKNAKKYSTNSAENCAEGDCSAETECRTGAEYKAEG